MIRKSFLTAALSAVLVFALSIPAFAGVWTRGNDGIWHYDTLGRGTRDGFLKNQWAWLDGNQDGISECYYFDADGNMLASTMIQGFSVNADGQWTVNGVVQRRQVDVPAVETRGVSLLTCEPFQSNYFSRFETASSASGLKWKNGIRLSGDLDRAAFVSYRFDKTYDTLTITFSPEAGQSDGQNGRVSVTGLTSGKSLYRSDKILPTSDPVNITIRIPNEEGIRINAIRGCDYIFRTITVR